MLWPLSILPDLPRLQGPILDRSPMQLGQTWWELPLLHAIALHASIFPLCTASFESSQRYKMLVPMIFPMLAEQTVAQNNRSLTSRGRRTVGSLE